MSYIGLGIDMIDMSQLTKSEGEQDATFVKRAGLVESIAKAFTAGSGMVNIVQPTAPIPDRKTSKIGREFQGTVHTAPRAPTQDPGMSFVVPPTGPASYSFMVESIAKSLLASSSMPKAPSVPIDTGKAPPVPGTQQPSGVGITPAAFATACKSAGGTMQASGACKFPDGSAVCLSVGKVVKCPTVGAGVGTIAMVGGAVLVLTMLLR